MNTDAPRSDNHGDANRDETVTATYRNDLGVDTEKECENESDNLGENNQTGQETTIKDDQDNSKAYESDIADADNGNGLSQTDKDTEKQSENKGGSAGPIKDGDRTTKDDAHTQLDVKRKSSETRRSSDFDMCDDDDTTNQESDLASVRQERNEYKLVEALTEFVKHSRGDTVQPTHQEGTAPDALQTNSTDDPSFIVQLKCLFKEHEKTVSVLEHDLDQTKKHNESLDKMHKDLQYFVTRQCGRRDTTSRNISGNPDVKVDNTYDIVSDISWHYQQLQHELDEYKQKAEKWKSNEDESNHLLNEKDTEIAVLKHSNESLDKKLKQETERYEHTFTMLNMTETVNVDLAEKQMGLQEENQIQKGDIEFFKRALDEAQIHIKNSSADQESVTNQLNRTIKERSNQIDQQTLLIRNKDNFIEQLQKNTATLEEKCNTLTLRLSKIAGAHLTRNNPNITDLSDMNRPTKLAEKYSELYDNEWTDAYEEYTENWELGEEYCVKTMLDLLKTANDECLKLLQPQRDILKTLTVVTVKLDKPAVKQDLHIDPDTSNSTADKSSQTDKLFGDAEVKTDERDSTDESLQVNDNSLTTQEPNTDGTEEPMDTEENNTPEKKTEEIIEISGRSKDKQCHSLCTTETTEEQDIHANDQNQEDPEFANMTENQDTTEGKTKDKEQRIDSLYRQSQDKMVSLVHELPFESDVDTGEVTAEIKVTDEFTEEQKKAVSDMRKLCGVKLEQEGGISKIIAMKVAIKKEIDIKSNNNVMIFITKCAQLCWFMAIQEPPVVIGFQETTEDGQFDKDVYKAYTKVGKKLDFVVWPPVYLHKDGPMLCKGTAQGKD